MFRKLASILFVLILSLSVTVPVFAKSEADSGAGAVYVMTNAPDGNQILVFQREDDGSLSPAGVYATGGLGVGLGTTVPPDPLGSQDSLLLSENGRWLFAANAGSNDISVFRAKGIYLELVDRVPSGGKYPVSLAFDQRMLYVLNAAGDGNVSAFRLEKSGHLSMVPDAARSLDAATPENGSQPHILESPAQVGISPDGNFLVVTDKGGVSGVGRILVFGLGRDGIPSATYTETITQDPVPFAFIFDPYGRVVAVDASSGAVTAYAIASDGSLNTTGVAYTGQAATCWIGSSGNIILADNTGSGTVSALTTDMAGNVTLLDATAGVTGAGTLPLDLGISHDGRYLYSLEVGAGVLGAFGIQADGSLNSLGAMGSFPAGAGVQGIAVW